MKQLVLLSFLLATTSALSKPMPPRLTNQQIQQLTFLNRLITNNVAINKGILAVNILGADSDITGMFAKVSASMADTHFSEQLANWQTNGVDKQYLPKFQSDLPALVETLLFVEAEVPESVRLIHATLPRFEQLLQDQDWPFSAAMRNDLADVIEGMKGISKGWSLVHLPTDADREQWLDQIVALSSAFTEHVGQILEFSGVNMMQAYGSAAESFAKIREDAMHAGKTEEQIYKTVETNRLVSNMVSLIRVNPFDDYEINADDVLSRVAGEEGVLLRKAILMNVAHENLLSQFINGQLPFAEISYQYMQLLTNNPELISAEQLNEAQNLLAADSN